MPFLTRGFRRARETAGLPPGTLVFTGEQRLENVTIQVIDYDEEKFQIIDAKTVDECLPFKDTPTVTWMNIAGLHDVAIMEKLGEHFGFHSLLLEDILNTSQRPKYEDFEEYAFLVIKLPHHDVETDEVRMEQISIVLAANFVVSFQEVPADPFEKIRERIRTAKGRIRKAGSDYLAYALLDAVVDHYFVILESLGDRVEVLGEETVSDPTPRTLHTIQTLKRELANLRRSIWPLREVVGSLARGESPLVKKSTEIYLRDVYDHTIQVVETIETFRDMVSGMFDTYLSSVSNRMNEIMKVLTIIATIFIPITFVAGVYGMNFQHMPELSRPWGYPAALGVMLAVCIAMLAYFRRKRWL
jgi:magnesium transporter